MEHTGKGDIVDVVSRHRRIGSLLAPSRDTSNHQTRMQVQEEPRIKPETFKCPRSEAFHHNVGFTNQSERPGDPVVGFEIDDNGVA